MIVTSERTQATARPSPSQPEPFRYVRAWNAGVDHSRVYDRLLTLLESRRVISAANGQVIPSVLHKLTRHRLRTEYGWTDLMLEAVEQSVLDDLEDHPKWNIERATPRDLLAQLKAAGREDLIFKNRIVPIFSTLSNALICDQLQRMFGRAELLRTPGFVEVDSLIDGQCVGRVIRLDLEPWLSRRGFMVPVWEYGQISGFEVYRRPNDEKPFRLRTRGVALNA